MSAVTPRFIPVLLMESGRLVKGRRYRKRRYVGDPLNTARLFNAKHVDELALLDIGARKERRVADLDLLAAVADECMTPLMFGGGVDTLADVRDIIRCGVEKVLVCTAVLDGSRLVEDAVDEFGAQAVAVGVEYDVDRRGRPWVTTDNGSVRHRIDPVAHAVHSVERGAGEIFLMSVARDGMRFGLDTTMIARVSDAVDVPVIPVGGGGEAGHLVEAVQAGAAGAGAGTMFVLDASLGSPLVSYPMSGRSLAVELAGGGSDGAAAPGS